MSLSISARDRIVAVALVAVVAAVAVGLLRASERDAHRRVDELLVEGTGILSAVTGAWLDTRVAEDTGPVSDARLDGDDRHELEAQLAAIAQRMSPSMSVAIVDDHGELVAVHHAPDGASSLTSGVGLDRLPSAGEVVRTNRSGTAMAASAQPVDGSSWQTVVVVPRQETVALVGGLVDWRALAGAALAVVAAACAAGLWVRGRHRARATVAAAATAEARAAEWEVLFAHGATPKLVLDRTGRIRRANRSAERLLGLSSDELAGLPAADLVIAEEPEKGIVNEAMEVLAGGHGAALCRFVAARGQVRHGLLAGAPILDEDGDLSQIVVQIVDLTEQRAIQDQLEHSRAELAALLDNSPVAACIFTPAGVELVNKALCELTGYAAHDLYRLPTLDTLVHPDDRERVNAALRVLRRQPQEHPESRYGGPPIEHRLVTAGGRVIEVQSSAVVVDGTDGDGGHLIIQSHDVTGLRQAERAMARSRDALSAFSTVVAHDLKTPLTSMVGFLDLVLTQGHEMDEAMRTRVLNKVADSAQHASDQINHLLEEARRLSGSVRTCVALADLHDWLQQFLGPKLIETGASLELDSDIDLVDLPEDSVKQVLLNLVTNSLKYQRPGVAPQITLSVKHVHGHVLVAVEDNGRGIPPADAEAVFHRGRQLQGDIEGHGLGLHLCRQLVEAEGGTIGASPREPHGLRVEFTIPEQQSPQTAAEPADRITARR